mmetsp:Transcript_46948/g.57672  ORF Transcript_46948/g.57672 Transcript_46948/m.57672 type:complete len:423 (+) Transcript_46948:52-1320(+)
MEYITVNENLMEHNNDDIKHEKMGNNNDEISGDDDKGIASKIGKLVLKAKKASKKLIPKQRINERSTFEDKRLIDFIQENGSELAGILAELYPKLIIPNGIACNIVSYTMDLLPGIYEFIGSMHAFGDDNNAKCQLILNSKAQIMGGYFQENSFKYHITHGSFTYSKPYFVEFCMEYFNYNYKYKCYGEITRDNETNNLLFIGNWTTTNTYKRGGSIKMKYTYDEFKISMPKININDTLQFVGYPCVQYRNITNEQEQELREFIGYCNDNLMKIEVTLLKNSALSGYLAIYDNVSNTKYYGNTIFGKTVNCDNDNIIQTYNICSKKSIWDIYGGLTIYFKELNATFDGFYNGKEFRGVLAYSNSESNTNESERFGYFQWERLADELHSDDETQTNDTNIDDNIEITKLKRQQSLDSDDDDVY